MSALTPAVRSVGPADFGPPIGSPPVTGEIAKVTLQADSPGVACTTFNAANTAAVYGKIALVSRGTCRLLAGGFFMPATPGGCPPAAPLFTDDFGIVCTAFWTSYEPGWNWASAS
jgi:hypothetical protein